jgi:hypothetical protein
MIKLLQKSTVTILCSFAIITVVIVGFSLGKLYFDRLESQKLKTRFESSDGMWEASTDIQKGVGLEAVLWDFETYKLMENKPDLELFRVSNGEGLDRGAPELFFPLKSPSGFARPAVPRPMTESQVELVSRKVQSTMDFLRSSGRPSTP